MEVDTNDYKSPNFMADFWRFKIGINVIPADYHNKVPKVSWKRWQHEPIPVEQHLEWKVNNEFVDGIALVMGRVWHNADRSDLYLACIDTDNEPATKMLMLNPEKTLVLQRANAKDRAHSFFYSPRPVKRKPSSSGGSESSPKFELRCQGDIIYSGKHPSGYDYEIVGWNDVVLLSESAVLGVEIKVYDICKEFGLNSTVEQPTSDLFKDDFEIFEGDNRSLALKRAMMSLLQRCKDILSLDEMKNIMKSWEAKHCRPPYSESSGIFERNWKQAVDKVFSGEQQQQQPQQTQKSNNPTERIMQENTFKTCTDNAELYYFDDKIYIPGQEWRIREQARQIVEDIENKDITEIISYIKDSTYIDRSKFDSDPDLIVVDNGILNVHTKELEEHTPNHLSLTYVPVEYRPGIDCPNIKEFLNEVMGSQQDIDDLIKLIGYCLIPSCEYEIAAMLYGDGRNGKGTLLKLIETFLGRKNCSNRSLQDLDNNRFAVADLFGKMANILADLKSLKMKETGYFKMIVSGDTLAAEKKFRDAFSFRNRAKLFFSANEIPETEDKTDAFFRRWRLFPMFKKFDVGLGRDTQLIKKLTTPEELSGLLNWALEGLAELVKRGGLEQDIDKIRNEWEIHTNDVSAFLYEKCTVDVRNKEYYTPTSELYAAYLEFCKNRNSRPHEFSWFGRKLSESDIMNRRRTVNGEQVHVYEGVILGLEKESWTNEPK